jgi:hypothetical protein
MKQRDREASILLEPTGSAKARKTKNKLAEKHGGRGEEKRKDPERAESLSKEQNPLALLRRGPMLWRRVIGSIIIKDETCSGEEEEDDINI